MSRKKSKQQGTQKKTAKKKKRSGRALNAMSLYTNDNGLYLRPFLKEHGRGLVFIKKTMEKKKKQALTRKIDNIINGLPKRGLSNYEIIDAVNRMKILFFRGVFAKDDMPDKPLEKECGIINLGSKFSGGFHWNGYIKNGCNVIYFDSFGDNSQPRILFAYFKGTKKIFYNQEWF